MLLHTLLRRFSPDCSLEGIPDVQVCGVREDSRRVQPGDLFVARGGTKTDGRNYIADAAARGAVAVIADRPVAGCPLPQVIVADAARAAGRLAAICHGEPCQAVRVLGVTGTNGKTTTTYLIRHILGAVNRRCGLIGTVEIDDGRSRREAEMTTPGATDLVELLAAMRDNECCCCAMEVSSHALDQGRVDGMLFAGAAFTNLTGDHLDYHKTKKNYAAAKARLFEMLDESGIAVVNAHDRYSKRMVERCRGRVLTFGFSRSADYRARDISIVPEGSRFVLVSPDGEAEVSMQLVGRHNIANALTASALVMEVFHLSVHQVAAALATAPVTPGRLQPVRCGQPFSVLVDYAHTDDALKNVLNAVRPLTRGMVRVVFGCGGDRDRTKRPRMAKVAEELADAIYLTSDNPRTENPADILREIITGFSADVNLTGEAEILMSEGVRGNGRDARATSVTDEAGLVTSERAGGSGKTVHVEIDRRAAIRRAIADARPGDVILLAGKGHENYQIIGTEKRHFDDVEEATRAIQGAATAAA